MQMPPKPETPALVPGENLKVATNQTIYLHRAKGVTVMEPKFLWYPYVPEGMITFLEGDPGTGKSWISIQLAADLSQGRKLPGQEVAYPPSNVLMFTGEEPLGAMRARLEKSGANPDRVWLSDSIFPMNKKGMSDLAELVNDLNARMVFIDPLQSFLSGDLDINNAKDMQQALRPLVLLAQQTDTAVVIIRHLRKAGGANAKHAGIGSIALTGTARSVIQTRETKGGNHVMSHVKYNYSDRGDTLSFDFQGGEFKWLGTFADHANSGGTEPKVLSKTPGKKILEAQQFLFDALKDGPKPVLDLYKQASDVGILTSSLQNAKNGLAKSRKMGTLWHWELLPPEQLPKPTH